MARRTVFRRLFWYSLALQLLLCGVYAAAAAAGGRGVAAIEEMLLAVYGPAVPIAFLIGLIFGGWDDIGVVLWAFPLIGATLYSLLLAALGAVVVYAIRKARTWTDPGEDGLPPPGRSPGSGASAPASSLSRHPAVKGGSAGRTES